MQTIIRQASAGQIQEKISEDRLIKMVESYGVQAEKKATTARGRRNIMDEVVCTLCAPTRALIALLKQEWGNVTCASEVLHSARTPLTAETFVSWLAPTAGISCSSRSRRGAAAAAQVYQRQRMIRLRFDLVKAAREHEAVFAVRAAQVSRTRNSAGAIRRRAILRRTHSSAPAARITDA